ncbi:CDK5 regulatory subunit-associated protein 2 isoform X2 [Denticeps clupeoides]|uniref:CDK5 regulatory subunit-associated protein 2 isoform X2 n=1 Tax=Denticeps clupeoides TaxID=299321 RepID=UPI0010A42EE9|nr:golgin subfamily A member 4-like isoform X2 [Denticeps clupeoides]
MRDPCRVCGTCLQGSQCRWLFGVCGRKRLAVALAGALGACELRRDGHSEFLCGRCVFLLERVVQCDTAVSQLQESHAVQVHALLNERDDICLRIRRKYLRSNGPDEVKHRPQQQGREEQDALKQDSKSTGKRKQKAAQQQARLTRHSSFHDTQHASLNQRPAPTRGLPGQTRGAAFPPPRRSSSLLSLRSLEHRQTQPLLWHAPARPHSLHSDWPRLMRSIQHRPLPRMPGSRIPVLSRSGSRSGHAHRATQPITDQMLREMEELFNDEYTPLVVEVCELKQSEVCRLESVAKKLTEDLNSMKCKNQELQTDNQELSGKLDEKGGELEAEKKNAVKRDKTIQGLSLVLKEKEKEIEELYRELEDRDAALVKAREAIHKAQLQKYQGAEEQQSLLLERQAELSRLQAELHASVCESRRLERSVSGRDAEIQRLTDEIRQLQEELEQLQQQKQRADKTINDLQNQLKKLKGELQMRESEKAREQSEELEESRRREHTHESTVHRLTHTLTHKEQQLQEYMDLIRDMELDRTAAGSDVLVCKLRERLKEKEELLERAQDEKFAAVEDKENELHQLQLRLREKERDLERLNNLLGHNQETINGLDALVKERDVELQQHLNSLKNLQRSQQTTEDNLNRALRERDALIQQLQNSMQSKSKELEELAATLLSQSQPEGRDLAERLSVRLRVAEVSIEDGLKERERLLTEHQSIVNTLLNTISSKEQLLQESTEQHARVLREREAELQELHRQLTHAQQQLNNTHAHTATAKQEGHLIAAQLRTQLAEKEDIINKLLEQGQERDRYLFELKSETTHPQVLELRQTIELLQQQLEEREEFSEKVVDDQEKGAKKSIALLKKQLVQKTEALNKALRREEELQSLVSKLEERLGDQTANIETLAHTISSKGEIISPLQRAECRSPGPPQRQSTSVGGDSQKEVLPPSSALHIEWEGLNRALRMEQQLYSNLVRAVKQQDSIALLQALQLELTAVQLLRQQLEAGIHGNEQLREQLETEMQRANQKEGAELQSLRVALEEARRWNTSLQARLGQIQSRGGGVGQSSDTADSYMIADQTSYMSICLGEEPKAELDELSVSQLRLKVAELQALNAELQKKAGLTTKFSSHSQHLSSSEMLHTNGERMTDISTQTEFIDTSQTSEEGDVGVLHGPRDQDRVILRSLLSECGVETLSQLRDVMTQLHAETDNLRMRLKDQRLSEKKQFAESSSDSDCQTDLRNTVRHLRQEAKGHRKVICLLKEQLQHSTSPGCATFDPELIVTMAREMERLREENEVVQRRAHTLEGKLHGQDRGQKKKMREKEGEMEKEVESGTGKKNENATKEQLRRERDEKETDTVTSEKKNKDDETNSSQSSSNKWTQHHHMARHAAYVKSRLPVPVRPTKHMKQDVYDELVSDRTKYPHPYPCHAAIPEAEEQKKLHCTSPAQSDSTSSTLSREKADMQHDGARSAELEAQLALMQQECEEKEDILCQRMKQWKELRAEIQEKDKLVLQYQQALQAAESTIAYLTACSLDSERGVGVSEKQSQSVQTESGGLGATLLECVSTAEAAIADLSIVKSDEGVEGTHALCDRLERLLQEVSALKEPQELQRTMQDQSQLSAELHKRLKAAEAQVSTKGDVAGIDVEHTTDANILQASSCHIGNSKSQANAREISMSNSNHDGLSEHGISVNSTLLSPQREGLANIKRHTMQPKASGTPVKMGNNIEELSIANEQLSECLRATEGAVEALITWCSSHHLADPFDSHPGSVNAFLWKQMDHLFHALQQRNTHVVDHAPSLDSQSKFAQVLCSLSPGRSKLNTSGVARLESIRKSQKRDMPSSPSPTPQDLHHNLLLLLQLFRERAQKACELEEQLSSMQENQHAAHTFTQRAPSTVGEEKVQDQGYETSGRSEQEASSTDADVVLDTTPSSPSYPSSPGLSLTPRPSDLSDPAADAALLRQQLAQLRSQVESQQKVIQHLQGLLQKSPLSVRERDRVQVEVEDKKEMTRELERERTLNRSASLPLRSQSASPSRIESLVQSQARELCELRQQIRVSGVLGAEQRRVLLDLRGALEDLVQATQQHQPVLGEHIQQSLDHSLELLELLQSGDTLHKEEGSDISLPHSECMLECASAQCLRSQLEREREQHQHQLNYLAQQNQRLAQNTRLQLDLVCSELQQKSRLIQSLQDQLRVKSPRSPQGSVSNGNITATHHHSPPGGYKGFPGAKLANGVASPDRGDSGGTEGKLWSLRRENSRLMEQLRCSEELNAMLRSELDLHKNIFTQNSQESRSSSQPEAARHDTAGGTISTELLAEHLQELRTLRLRLEETIRTNEKLREQLERRLLEAERDPGGTNIFIAGLEEQGQLASEVRKLWSHNHTLREQLNQDSRDKQKENERLREALARRTAKLERSRREHTRLQENVHRLQDELRQQKQHFTDSQQLLQSLRVELQLHDHIRNTNTTGTGEQRPGTAVDLSALLNEVRILREQLERSIRNHTININYLLHTDESGRPDLLHPPSHTEATHDVYESGSSVGSGSPPPSRLVPGHRVFAARKGQHVLGLTEDYTALRTHLTHAHTLIQQMEAHTRDCSMAQCMTLSASVSSMHQVLEEASRLLKLFWKVTLPTDARAPQDELLRNEISRLKSRLLQQESVLSGAVRRLHSTNQLKEGMERLIIDQLSMTHGILKKARGNLENHFFSVFGLSGLPREGRPTQYRVRGDQTGLTPPPGSPTGPDSDRDHSAQSSC